MCFPMVRRDAQRGNWYEGLIGTLVVAKEKQMNRKTFFKEGPLVFLRAFAQGAQEDRQPNARGSIPQLRPPGAAEEDIFLDLCCGTGACVEVCPADAIQLRPRKDDSGRTTPVIVPREAACVLCEDLACMKACPTGALSPIEREKIRVGIARVDSEACLAWQGIDPGCDYCVTRCPVGREAIAMEREGNRHGPAVKGACVGCGVCEFFCPTHPVAICIYERSGT